MLLLGFPSNGLVGPVAVSYVVEKLRLTRFAGLYGQGMPPLAVVEDGVAYSPVRFYSGKERCGPGGQCDRLVVGIADVPIEPDFVDQAARAIMRWAKRRGVSLVVILEGIAAPNVGGSKPPKDAVLGVRSATSGQDFSRLGVTPVSAGSLSSHAAALLLAGNALGVDVLAMFTTARQDLPDPRASGVLLRKVDPMLPNLALKPAALERRATELDAQMRGSLKESKQQLKSLKKTYEMMYH